MTSKWTLFLEGMKRTTPKQMLQSKIALQVGQLVGFLIACGYVLFTSYWYWILFLSFTTLLLILDLYSSIGQLKQINKLETMLTMGGMKR